MLGYLDFMVLSKHIMEIFPDEDDITADIYSATKSLSYLILGDPQQTNRPSPCTQKKFAIALRNTCEDLLQGPELKDINQEALSRIEDLAHQAVQWKINADANERGDNDCTKCNVTFSSQDELFAHKQEEHSSDSISSGSNTPDLRHEERDEKYCDTCHDTFAGSYRAHMDAHHGPKSEDESDQEYDLFMPKKERRSPVVRTPRSDIERCVDMPLEIKIASARYGLCYGTSVTAQRFQLLHPDYHFSKSSVSAWMKRDLAKWIEEIPEQVAAVAKDYEEKFPDDVPLAIVFKIKQNLIRERLAGFKVEKTKIPHIIRTTLQEMNREEDYEKYITPDFIDLMFSAGSKFVLGTLAHIVVAMKDF